MPTNFPTSIDSFTNPVATNPMTSPDHATQHANENLAIEAIETQVGTTGAFNFLKNSNNLSDVANPVAALENLGGAPLLAPSGDGTGATDAANINAVLAAGNVANLNGTYYINAQLVLAGANGLNCTPRTVINWVGAVNTTAIGTVALSTSPPAFTGVLIGGTLAMPQTKITGAMDCIYIALPYPSLPLSMDVAVSGSSEGSPVAGSYAYDLDGGANPGPFKVNAHVFGQFQAGFRVRCNHATIDSCASGNGGSHVSVDQDSTGGSAINVQLIGSNHGYHNSVSFLHLIYGTAAITSRGGYNESGPSETSNVEVLVESTFAGWADVQDMQPGFDSTLLTHYSTSGYVRLRDAAQANGGYDNTFVGQASGVPILVGASGNPGPVNVATVTTTATLALGGNTLTLTSGDNLTLTMPPAVAGATCWVKIIQPASGTTTNTVTQATSKWPGGTKPTMSTGASATDRYDYFSDGTSWFGVITGQAFA